MTPESEDSLGTGFVPNAPERTAEMIAGRQAQEAVESLLGTAGSSPEEAVAAEDRGAGDPSSNDDSEPSGSSDTESDSASQAATAEAARPAASRSGQMAGQPQPGGQPPTQSQPGQSQPGQSPSEQQSSNQQTQPGQQTQSGQQSQSAEKAGDSRQGDGGSGGGRRTEAVADGPLRQIDAVGRNADGRAGERSGDAAADAAGKSLEREPWFAKLPPEMRKAIRAKSQRRAPRGYEEKLDRYFQNIDE